MDKKLKVGIITFHASYNFGSVMQAYATQTVIENLGYEAEIINFRPESQKDKYSVFPIHDGWKTIVRNLMQIRFIGMKVKSNKKYEAFINDKLKITEEYNNRKDLKKLGKYDIYLSGSDQIWGYDIPEFATSKEDIRGVYYFENIDGFKISYGSSTGIATVDELRPYAKCMKDYSQISVREENGKNIVSELANKPVTVVLDPTYLIPHQEWVKMANEYGRCIKEKYILIYSLQGIRKAKMWKELIKNLTKDSKMKFVCVIPFAPFEMEDVINMANAGPMEILSLFAFADYIYTDTFHGLSFSIHFRKPFTVYEEKSADYRKKNVLKMFSLEERETNNLNQCCIMFHSKIDYGQKEDRISTMINNSMSFLKQALKSHTI